MLQLNIFCKAALQREKLYTNKLELFLTKESRRCFQTAIQIFVYTMVFIK